MKLKQLFCVEKLLILPNICQNILKIKHDLSDESSLSHKETPGWSSLFHLIATHLLAAIRANLRKPMLTLILVPQKCQLWAGWDFLPHNSFNNVQASTCPESVQKRPCFSLTPTAAFRVVSTYLMETMSQINPVYKITL